MDKAAVKDFLLFQIQLYLEDVAEKPERLERAKELAKEAIDKAFKEAQ